MPKARLFQVLNAMVCLIALAGFSVAQSSPPPASNAPQSNDSSSLGVPRLEQHTGQAGEPADDQPTTTLKVNVGVVQLFFNVKDKRGALIPNLSKDDFDIYEDGKPQTVKYFAAESNLPLTLGILIDASGSQMRVLDMEKEVGGYVSDPDSSPRKTWLSSSAST